jgi:hypothetical protein
MLPLATLGSLNCTVLHRGLPSAALLCWHDRSTTLVVEAPAGGLQKSRPLTDKGGSDEVARSY